MRVGIIGAGFGRVHARAFQAVAGVEVVAVCSRQRAKAEAFAAEFGVAGVFTDAAALIESGLDVVVVAAPNREHYPMTLRALAAGCHVLCEKPLAASVAEATEMVAAARRADRRLAVHMNRRMQPGVEAMRRAHDAGQLGQVRHVRATWHRQRGIPAREGFLTRARAGGGVLIDLGVHVIDQALYVQGFPEVEAVRAHLHADFLPEDVPDLAHDVEDAAFVHLTLAGGGSITAEVSWASTHHVAEERILQVYGSAGGARRVVLGDGDEDHQLILHRRGAALSSGGAASTPVPSVQADLVAALREGRPPRCSGEQGLALLRILEAAYESAQRGVEVALAG